MSIFMVGSWCIEVTTPQESVRQQVSIPCNNPEHPYDSLRMSSPGKQPKAHCSPKPRQAAPGTRVVSLPVLATNSGGSSPSPAHPTHTGHAKVAHSKAARWRALTLFAVYIVMIIHVVLWRIHGTTISPVEPSESMHTLRTGAINAGFVFFALAIGSTLILGRWFCGWGCHIVAIQDACSWLMNKVGVKPKPFRSRLLMWVPLGFALYMFVWPVLHREVVRRIFMDSRGRLPDWLGQSDPIPGISTEFIVHEYWATFPTWYVAIPFILVCTVGAVYFLGNKGFCTYGCPYGGFFAPADKLAIGKIRVTDACEGCGHCTAVCTSNVRVHEEVRDFGMVVDPGCMKCMDCVTVCPNDALYFGLGKPSILAKPRNAQAAATRAEAKALRAARYDLGWYEELGIAFLFLFYFMAYRQMMNSIPMLMAIGMGGIMAYCAWRVWTFRPIALGGTPNSRLQSLQLRLRGRLRPAGFVLLLITSAMTVVALWSGYVRLTHYRGELTYVKLHTPLGIALRPDFQPAPGELANARRVIDRFTTTERIGNPLQSLGLRKRLWKLSPDNELAISYAHLITGDMPSSLARMERVIDEGRPTDSLVFQAGQLLQSQGKSRDEVLALYRRALKLHPELDGLRATLAAIFIEPPTAQAGLTPPLATRPDPAAARALLAEALTDKPLRGSSLLNAARLELAINPPGAETAALAFVEQALALTYGRSSDLLLSAAGVYAQLSDRAKDEPTRKLRRERAIDLARQAAEFGHALPQSRIAAAGFLINFREPGLAADQAAQAAATARKIGPHSTLAQTFISAANILSGLGRFDEALALYKDAATNLAPTPADLALAANGNEGGSDAAWGLHGIATTVLQIGLNRHGPYILEGVRLMELARDAAPGSSVIRHDLAMGYYALNRQADALREITTAATVADKNAYLARRLSGLLAESGQAQESVRWERIAVEREAPTLTK